jgi:hypothetical protein
MDFWARGAYHRVRKMARGPRRKAGTRWAVGFDGFYRKRKKARKLPTPDLTEPTEVEATGAPEMVIADGWGPVSMRNRVRR